MPLKKAGKSPGCISSYRPVSLASCVAKTLERILHNILLCYLAETRDWLCTEQAGFRKIRSCEDQVLRLTQSISDGYQATKPKNTALTLLDYSKAFDCVWREDLLIRAIDKDPRLHTHSGCATSFPTEKPKCRSTKTEADSYHYARDSLKGPSCHRSSSCCTPTTFGGSYPKTWWWPCLPTMFRTSAATPIKKSLKQPFRKL